MARNQQGNNPLRYSQVIPLNTQGKCNMQQPQTAPWHEELVNFINCSSYIACDNFGCNGELKKIMNM